MINHGRLAHILYNYDVKPKRFDEIQSVKIFYPPKYKNCGNQISSSKPYFFLTIYLIKSKLSRVILP